MVENAFERMVFFASNSRIGKELKDRADEYRRGSLIHKAMETLVFHRHCK